VVSEQTDSLCEHLVDPTCRQIEASRNLGYRQVLVIIHRQKFLRRQGEPRDVLSEPRTLKQMPDVRRPSLSFLSCAARSSALNAAGGYSSLRLLRAHLQQLQRNRGLREPSAIH
jgi:hypothetical protein